MSELQHNIDTCLLRDRPRLRRLAIQLRASSGEDAAWLEFDQQLAASAAVARQRAEQRPAITFPAELPICERLDEIRSLIAAHQVIVLCGETGSGKSTQLPKVCLDLGRGVFGRIGHTQPRRIAARSLATRIAAEAGQEVGDAIGYKVRFRDHVGDNTQVKLLTDGMLLAEIRHDRDLLEYDTLIIDEAHERSLNIDFLLGYLHKLLPRRPDLKLIITSATIDPGRFSRHFNDAPVIEVSGRTFPVDVRYREPEEAGAGERDEAMQQSIVDAIDELSLEGTGDILVFLSGEREIRETAETLHKHKMLHSEVIPLYARLSPSEQARVFAPSGRRHIVLSTNVAETSLTVPGIRYVIDAGFARISRYSARSKIQRLPVERISKASAEQRKGRCGRVAEGICIRLYSEDDYAARADYTEPEIQRTNLAAVILQMATLGFGDVASFPFVDPPDARLVKDGYKLLEELAAVDQRHKVTKLGNRLARLPVDPRIGRMLLAAAQQGCLREVVIIAAALSVQDPRERPAEKRQDADEAHAQFADERSDFMAFLKLWQFLEENRKHLTRRKFERLCKLHFLSPTRVREWHDVQVQLRVQLHELGYRDNEQDADYATLHRALLTGLLSHVGLRTQGNNRDYLGARNRHFFIFPGSGLFAKQPKWVMAAEMVETTRLYARSVAAIEPDWIEPLAKHLIKHSYSSPRWQARRGQVAADEKVTLYGMPIVPRRVVNYGPIDPVVSREIFIRFGLTEGDMNTRAPFWRHNRELIAGLRDIEAKSRRRDLLVDEEVIYGFYTNRVPEGIYSIAQLESWLRELPRDRAKVLHMRMEDLQRADMDADWVAQYPDSLDLNGSRLPLRYHFAPGESNDGVTLTVPAAVLGQLTPGVVDRVVPGLLLEKITLLLKSLPKAIRRQLVPIPEYAERCLQALPMSDAPLVQTLGSTLKQLAGIHVPEDSWQPDQLPAHLNLQLRVLDDDGRSTLAMSRNLHDLQKRYAGAARKLSPEKCAGLGKADEAMTEWTCGALPQEVVQQSGKMQVKGFPALVDGGDHVRVKAVDSLPGAQRQHHFGVRRLLMLRENKAVRALKKNIRGVKDMRLQYAKAAQAPNREAADDADLVDQLVEVAFDRAFLPNGAWDIRDVKAFEHCREQGRPKLGPALLEISGLIGDILAEAHAVRSQLAKTTQANWQASVADMQAQLDRLVYRGFVHATPAERLLHLPRYLKGLRLRLEKLHAGGAARDGQRMAEMTELHNRWLLRWQQAEQAEVFDARLDEIRWMLEELRVSLFAQELKTPAPVSIKRISKRWEALGL
ncbi:ATP-dependent RNA helicase HrpA [Thiosocius teredinicola]|uniref:ATP-dependent RNA helicase HrpA n=1 Tax=Thiosocius teredinicola TaxID=1973002 RepID=UPI000990A710